MSWSYRDVSTFPARYAEAMREAVAALNSPIVFNLYQSRSAALAAAQTFRHFRWCIREKPGQNTILSSFENMFQFRTSVEKHLDIYSLNLTASPTKLSELHALNPHLSGIITAECQY